MSWNYRVIRHRDPVSETDTDEFLQIHEVYYDKHGNPEGVTENGVRVGSEDLEGMKWVLDKMREALDKPILDYKYFLRMERNYEGKTKTKRTNTKGKAR